MKLQKYLIEVTRLILITTDANKKIRLAQVDFKNEVDYYLLLDILQKLMKEKNLDCRATGPKKKNPSKLVSWLVISIPIIAFLALLVFNPKSVGCFF